jgi:phenylalanyl-tRNA synthetase beta chain
MTESAPGGWRTPALPADFYAVRALLEGLLEAAGLSWWAEEGRRPFLHPGRAASILSGNERKIGWLGEMHPLVAREWDIAGPVAGFELDVDAVVELSAGAPATYGDVTSFPAVLQDLAVVVAEGVSAADVIEAVRTGGGELLADVSVFDLYRGPQVGEGNKSLALRLEFRAPDRTLTDEEVAQRRAAIERELSRIGGRLRE